MCAGCPDRPHGRGVTGMKYSKNVAPIDTLKALRESFLTQKRAFGFKYISMEDSLRRFIRFTEAYGLSSYRLSQDLVLAFCEKHPGETSKSQANRSSDIRQFAKFLNANGFETYTPKPPRKVHSKFTPYIFTHDEMQRIFKAADSMKLNDRYNSAEVYPVLFRLLYGCGLRVSEALGLRVRDVDLKHGVLTVKSGKFNKTRLVVMSESLTAACIDLKNKIHIGEVDSDYFFKNRDGAKRSKRTISDRFRELLWESGIPYRGKGSGPRLHDLRHCFCCHALKQMSDAGIDLYCALPVLSTYVGHSSIKATEQYIRLTEEFYPDIASKVRDAASQVYPEVYRIEAD